MGAFGNAFGDGLGSVRQGSLLNQWGGVLAPAENLGLYYQMGQNAKSVKVIAPINEQSDCVVHYIQPFVPSSEGLSVTYYGISKGYNVTLPTSKTGTFLADTAKSGYASVVGATVTLDFIGTSIYFYSYMDNRGGYWNIEIDGGEPIKMTRWSAVAGYTLTKMGEWSTRTPHNLKLTFMGDDPDHVPSGGAGTGRGWICLNNSLSGVELHYKAFYVTDCMNVNYVNNAAIPPTTDLINTGSVPEFAWKIKKLGAVYEEQHVPDHTTPTNTLFAALATDRAVKVDGIAIDLAVTNTFAKPCNSVVVDQKFIGFNSNETLEHLIDVKEVITVDYRGMKANHKITALQDLYTSDSYISMLPLSTAKFDNFQTSQGNEYAMIATDGSKSNFTEGSGFTWGYATKKTGSDLEKSYLAGIKITPVSWNLPDGLTKSAWIEHRNATLQKLYLQIAKNEIIPSGTVYNFTAYYVFNLISDAYNVVKAKFGLTV